MKHPFLINLLDPEDCISVHEDIDRDNNFLKERLRLILPPVGPDENNEVTDSLFFKGNEAHHHVHTRGYETFFVGDGEIELTVRGRKCHVTDGDIIHIGPWDAHRMIWLKDTPWRGVFHQMNITQAMVDKMLVQENCPDTGDDDYYLQIYRESNQAINKPSPVAVDVPKSEITEVRTPDFAFATHKFDGITLRQKVGRWETGGVKEIWELVLEDGFYAKWSKPNPLAYVYYIKEGSVRFSVYGNEFVAPHDSIVHIPTYAVHSFKSEGSSVMYDLAGGSMTLDFISDCESYKAISPEKLEDKEFFFKLAESYKCYVTEWGVAEQCKG